MSIAAYKAEKALKNVELAKLLGISEGHASDIVNGKQPVSLKIAKRMAELTGRPWHVFVDGSDSSEPETNSGAAA